MGILALHRCGIPVYFVLVSCFVTRAPMVLYHSTGMPSSPAIFPLSISSIAYYTFHTSNRLLTLSSSRRRLGNMQPSSWRVSSSRCRSLFTLWFFGRLILNMFPSPPKYARASLDILYLSVFYSRVVALLGCGSGEIYRCSIRVSD